MKSATALLLILCLSGALVQAEMASQSDISAELGALRASVEELRLMENRLAAMAFSVALTEAVGPFRVETTIIYPNIITNIGNAYNAHTGFFTAPISGVYFFRFNVMDSWKDSAMGAALYKNNQRVLLNNAWNHWEDNEHVSNGVVLELSQGDVVHMRLPAWYSVTDFGEHHFNIFSGFLLFPM
uniref:C1q domain-containing protein n=1 Tax=Sander lucioperca TaxID=283035 RepID=A0A8C9XI21_SANLU